MNMSPNTSPNTSPNAHAHTHTNANATTEPETALAGPAYDDRHRVTQPRVLRSEWTKLRSLPSTLWSLLTAVVTIVGFGVLYSMVRVTRPPSQPAEVANFDPAAISLSGVQLEQLAIGVLGILVATGEYSTGTFRTTFAAVPRRLPVLWGKCAVVMLVTFVLCVPASFVAFNAGQSILSSEQLDTKLAEPGTARAVVGGALYLVVVGLIGTGLGALLRSSAAAIASLFGILFGLQVVAGFLPDDWSERIYRYLPGPAGTVISSVRPDDASLGPWP